jgi:L-fuconolactonase
MPTRRTFLKWTAAGALSASALGAGSRAVLGEQSVPEKSPAPLDVIDCHTHFYDPSRPQGVPWPPKDSPLYRTVLPEHLRSLPKPRPLAGTVIVEASPWVEDNQWLLDLASDDPFIVGIVGNLRLGDDEFARNLKRFAANRLFRGIRASQQAVEQQLAAGRLDDFKQLAEHDLALDVNGGPEMPLMVAKLAAELPQLRIIVNHIANVRIDGDGPPQNWMEAIQAAAKQKNVFCKVSALVEGAARGGRKAPTDVDFYRPYLDVVWRAFGDDRLIYGSNWPVSDRAADYATVQQIALDYVSDRGAEAAKKFFALNAQQGYQWVDRSRAGDR